MYLSRKILDVSLPDVGDFFGGRDHSTVIHSCDKIANELENDAHLRNVVNELERKIKGE
jgi:chromosomal replication initiator protein